MMDIRRNIGISLICLLSVLAGAMVFPRPSSAREGSRFSARAGPGAICIEAADNLWAGGESLITGLDRRPSSASRCLPFTVLEFRYRDADRKSEYFLGTRMEKMAKPGLGLKRETSAGVFEVFAYYWPLSKVWKDPYLVGVHREKTPERQYGLEVSLENIMDRPFSFSMGATLRDIEDDRIGGRFGELGRDGIVYEAAVGYRRILGGGWMLEPSLAYERGAFEGSAESYHGGTAALGLKYMSRSLIAFMKLSLGISDHDGRHPSFGRKRKEDAAGVVAMAVLPDVMGLKGYFLNLGLAYSEADSNIVFFEREKKVVFLSAGYNF